MPFSVAPVEGLDPLTPTGEVRALMKLGSSGRGLILWLTKGDVISSHWSGFGGSGSAEIIQSHFEGSRC